MARQLPPLTALPAFEATARLGSVTAAAHELGRTHSAVSKQIRHLVEDLGGDLFEKVGIGLQLTPRGERFQQLIGPLLDQLEAISSDLRTEMDKTILDIGISSTLAMRWFIPRMPNFYMRRPGSEMRLHMTGARILRDSEFDIMLSYDRFRDDFDFANPLVLGDTAYGPVCAPRYPIKVTDQSLRTETRLTQQSAPQSWQRWSGLSGRVLQSRKERIHQHHALVLEAAATAQGVALAERRLVEQDLASGRLIAPVGFVPVKDGFLAAVTPRGETRAIVRDAIMWLRDEAAKVTP